MRRRTDDEAALRSRLREQLRHADRLGAIGMMMSRVAHEIGTPLNVISARVRKIARGQAEGDQAREHARIAAEQTDRISLVIRRMLDYSRREGAREALPAVQLADAAVAMVETLARANELELHVIDTSRGARVLVDPVLIEQALVNLLINAVSVSPRGRAITVSVEAGTFACEVGGAPGPAVCLAVQDEGPGVPEAIRKQIFEPFFTTKALGEGTGLGLGISATIVSEHGGQLRLAEGGPGARFELLLLQQVDPPAAGAPR
jgi:signal transduction histidine kinase